MYNVYNPWNGCIGDLESAIREAFSVPRSTESRYICCPTLENKKLNPNISSYRSLLEAGLHSGQVSIS